MSIPTHTVHVELTGGTADLTAALAVDAYGYAQGGYALWTADGADGPHQICGDLREVKQRLAAIHADAADDSDAR